MEIRKSTKNDIPEILNTFDIARDYMVSHGNATQWGKGYPGEDVLARDIENVNSYVITEGRKIVGTFLFIIGDELCTCTGSSI